MNRGWLLSAMGFLLLAMTPLRAAEPAVVIPTLNKKVDFEADVLPILKRNCLACHDGDNAEADLVLETPKTILKGSEDGPVVVPRHSEKSSLLKTTSKESKPFMPPKNNKVGAEALKPDELAVLKAWIDQGATGTVNTKPKPLVWRPLPPGLHPILAVAVTGDGQLAACGRANQIFIYHVPTGKVVARLTDPKLATAANRSGYLSSAQRDYVQSLAFSPDGNTLASGEYRMVKLWQREPMAPSIGLGQGTTTAMASSADGKWFATAGKDNVIQLWDAATSKAVIDLPGHTAGVSSLKFSPDNLKLASVSADKTIRVWDITTGKIFSQTETQQDLRAVAWVRGGKQLATGGGDNYIRMWEMPAQADTALKPLKDLTGHTQPVTCLDATADGKQLLSGSRDGTVRHWSVEQSRQVRQLDNGAPIAAVAISPNGKTFASAGGNVAKLWSADKGQVLGEMRGDHSARAKVAGCERASAFAKNEIAYWKTAMDDASKAQSAKADVVKKASEAISTADKALKEAVQALGKATDAKTKPVLEEAVQRATNAKPAAEKALKDAQLAAKQAEQASAEAKAAAAKATTAQLKADAEVEAAKKALPSTDAPIRAIAFSPDGLTVATAGDDQNLRTWSAENGAGFDTYPSKLGPVQALGYTSDGRLMASTGDKGTAIWNTLPSWTLARTIGTGDEKSPLVNRVLTIDFTADGKLLATGGGVPSRSGELKLWNPRDGTLVREIKPSHSDTIFSLAFSPDGKALATASADKFVKVFDPNSGKLIKSLSGHTHYVLGVSWRPDGRMIASSGMDKVVKLWTYPEGEQTKTIEGFNKEVTAVRFIGVEGQILTAAADPRVRLLKPDGSNLKDFSGTKNYLFSIAATPDGQTILGGGQDSVLRAWNASSGKSLLTLDPPKAEVEEKIAADAGKK